MYAVDLCSSQPAALADCCSRPSQLHAAYNERSDAASKTQPDASLHLCRALLAAVLRHVCRPSDALRRLGHDAAIPPAVTLSMCLVCVPGPGLRARKQHKVVLTADLWACILVQALRLSPLSVS